MGIESAIVSLDISVLGTLQGVSAHEGGGAWSLQDATGGMEAGGRPSRPGGGRVGMIRLYFFVKAVAKQAGK